LGNLLQSALDCDESVTFITISELVEVTEEATDNALFQSEDLLGAINDCSDEKGVHGMDVTHKVAEKSEAEDDEVDSPPRPRIDVAIVNVGTAGRELSCSTSDGDLPPVADPRPLAAGVTDTQGTLGLEIPRPTEVRAVAEDMPSTNAARIVMVEEPKNDTVSDGGQETGPLGAGHQAGDDKALGELKGLKGLGKTLSEQTGHIGRGRNDAIMSIKNDLVFTELDTLVMVAREAIGKVVGTSARLARTTRDQAHGDTRKTRQGDKLPIDQGV
jgi:hypothetical protein